jgi:hypothetical protein
MLDEEEGLVMVDEWRKKGRTEDLDSLGNRRAESWPRRSASEPKKRGEKMYRKKAKCGTERAEASTRRVPAGGANEIGGPLVGTKTRLRSPHTVLVVRECEPEQH